MLRIFALLLFVIPANASAFLLYTTTNGDYVKWQREDITVILDESLQKLGPRNEVEEVIIESFEGWTNTADIPILFAFERGRCDPFSNTNQNCVTACDDRDRCYDREGEKGATTYLHFLPSSGRITGASIIFNAIDWRWTPHPLMENLDGGEARESAENTTCAQGCEDSRRRLDLKRVATHEIGHLLGVDHSDNPDAMMYFAMDLGDREPRALHADDIEAVTVLYTGSEDYRLAEAEAYSGCTAVTGRPSTGSLLSLMMLLSVLVIRRVRRGNR